VQPGAFRWNEWNLEHAGRHGIGQQEAERVVRTARRPYPLRAGDRKWIVWGPGQSGRLVQVVFVLDDDGTAYIIHARPLTPRERSRYKRRRRE